MDETDAEFETRLCKVIAAADIDFHEQDYLWRPLADGAAPDPAALACVRDRERWHHFVPAGKDDPQDGRFDVRDSARLFDVCQGVMDYWACPVGPAGDRFLNTIRTLIERGRAI